MPSNEVTIAEAARVLGKSPETIRRQIKARKLEGHQVDGPHGRKWRVVLPTMPEDGVEQQDGATLPAVPPERLLAMLDALATKQDVENIIRAVDELSHNHDTYQQVSEERDRLETALGEALERVRELEGELAEAKRPWWRRRRA